MTQKADKLGEKLEDFSLHPQTFFCIPKITVLTLLIEKKIYETDLDNMSRSMVHKSSQSVK